jgi:hypothetical protein
MKQFEITVKILVSVDDVPGMSEVWAEDIAFDFADMAVKYKSVGADKILEIMVVPA